jgi:hypothetical protein
VILPRNEQKSFSKKFAPMALQELFLEANFHFFASKTVSFTSKITFFTLPTIFSQQCKGT